MEKAKKLSAEDRLVAAVAADDWNRAVGLAKEIAAEFPLDVEKESWVSEQFAGWNEGKAKVKGLWRQARRAELADAEAQGLFIYPDPQPGIADKGAHRHVDSAQPEAPAMLVRREGRTKPEAVELEPKPIGSGHVAEPKPALVEELGKKAEAKPEPGGLVRLNLGAPYDVARTFIKRAVTEDGEGRYAFVGEVEGELVRKPTLWFWKGEFYRWNGQCYETVEPETIRSQVYDFLDRALELNGEAVKPKPKNVNEVVDGLKAGINFGAADVPVWMGVEERPEAKGLLACRNGLLEFETGKLWDHDPRFFGINSVDFEFDPRARCPRWERFLGEVWPGDGNAVETLQEFFGLWLTDETKYQKACVLIGPPRSGKGTIGRLLKGLLGRTSYVAVSLGTLGDTFGMEHLVGKKLALVPDVKLDGRANVTLVMERLLTTIGEDDQAINRKHKPYWQGKLGIRWLILGNDVPKFRGTDESGGLVQRCVMLAMEQNFFGKEDFDLTEKLLAERAGILNWAMEGWRRLKMRDRFVQPASGEELVRKLQASTSTMGAFVDECCEVGSNEKVQCEALWLAFGEWAEKRKLPVTLQRNTFSRMLHQVFPSIVTARPGIASNDDGRPRWFYGVRLKVGWRHA